MKKPCPECGTEVTVTRDQRYRTHGPRDNRCPGSATEVILGPPVGDDTPSGAELPEVSDAEVAETLATVPEISGDSETVRRALNDLGDPIAATASQWRPKDPEIAARHDEIEAAVEAAKAKYDGTPSSAITSSAPEADVPLTEPRAYTMADRVRDLEAELSRHVTRIAELESELAQLREVPDTVLTPTRPSQVIEIPRSLVQSAEPAGVEEPIDDPLGGHPDPEPAPPAEPPEIGDDGKAECPECRKRVTVNADNTLRAHGPRNDRCPGSASSARPKDLPDVPLKSVPAETAPMSEIDRTLPPVPAFEGTQELASLGATVHLGQRAAIAGAIMLVRMGVPLACDIEAEGKDAPASRYTKCVTFSDVPEGRHVVILDPRDEPQRKVIRWVLDHAPEIVFQNAPFDVPNLVTSVYGPLFAEEHAAKVTDILIYARLAEPDSRVPKSLGALANRYLGMDFDAKGIEAAGKAVGMRNRTEIYRDMDIDRPVYVRGAAADGVATARLVPVLRKAALTRLMVGHPFTDWGVQGQEALRLLEREQKLNRMMLRNSAVRGLRADLDYLDAFNERYAEKIHTWEVQLQEYGIRPGVSADMGRWLDAQGLVPDWYPRNKDGSPKGDKDNLPKINHPLAKVFLEHKNAVHVLNDYLYKVRDLAVDHGERGMRIHPVVNFLAAVSGRMSVGSPPYQQFPAEARGVIVADPGRGLTSIDWSQIEPVVIANIAGQVDLLEGYEAGTMDFYDAVSSAAGIARKPAKTQTLGSLYGQGLALTASKLEVDIEEAKRIKRAVFAPMPKVENLVTTLREIAEQYQLVPTISGRMLPIPSGWYENKRTGEKEWSVQSHKGPNYTTQGSAYDVLAEAMLACEERGYGEAIHMAMHDETVTDTEAAEDIRQIMSTPPEALIRHAGRVPVLRTDMVHMGQRWQYV